MEAPTNTQPLHLNQIKEISLYVKDLEATKTFYHNTIGLQVLKEQENQFVFFQLGTSILLCFILGYTSEDPFNPPHRGYGQVHLAIEVPTVEYDAWKKRIKSIGVHIELEKKWPHGFESFYFRDPDQHLIEIIPEGFWTK